MPTKEVTGNPVRTNFLSFSTPEVQEEDIEAAVRTIRSGWLSTGKEATAFEEAFVKYKGGTVHGAPLHAVALSSCTAALHLALLSLDLEIDDEVIVPSMTFSATAATVVHAGATPVFADVDTVTGNLTVETIARMTTENTKAVIVVHFAGLPCDMEAIQKFCNERCILIIEDCAHAIESKYGDTHTGTRNYAGCFSFYGTKNITTAIGEGGMLVTKHPRLIEFARKMSLHGMSKNAADRYSSAGFKHYDILAPGYKYNMSDVAAAFANSQLTRIDHNWAIRKSIWERYNQAFEDLPVFLPALTHENKRHAYHLYTLHLSYDTSLTRNEILDAMTAEGIGVGVHYKALHNMTYWKEVFRLKPESFPGAQYISERTISLPLTAALSQSDVNDVIKATKKVIKWSLR